MIIDTNYTTDDSPALRNPERGIYSASDPNVGTHTIVPEWLWLHDVCMEELTWKGLNDPRTTKKLNEYAQQLEKWRADGVKVLFRPRYDKPNTNNPNLPSDCEISGTPVFHAKTMDLQRNHIDAVAAMLGDYRDVIAYIQAGYLGRWGEWNTENDNIPQAPFLYNKAERAQIIDHILSTYADHGIKQHVELRRPVFMQEVLDRNPIANVGFHQDCFMSNDSDGGTYSNFSDSPANIDEHDDDKLNAEWKKRAQSFTAERSFGGETCPLSSPPNPPRWHSCSNMRSEPATFHMNYLNIDWADNVVSTWEAGGCYDEIRSRLGYRFEVTRVEYTPTVAPGQNFTVSVDILNSGWARLHKHRDAQLVLRKGSTTHVYPLSNGATETWKPGTTTQISVTDTAPPTGTYELRLTIPDPDAPTRILYAVKLASQRCGVNIFDASTAENDLGISMTVQ
ncbi:DUF4832 domain-containing protein [Arthrobacter sp. Cr_A7]|uniref:DUF4832 domain-containing protein n=1 Tax=Arthrobacter sp. Cr_A7 TaxID=3031017 RepID=UPI0023DB27F2|nr:DUF4832 domain-containing protein [Arthrobacter sp. Cr_A7]MDF2049316.1 DUF4832 domain-containing protein [Arthrobacter sp. Cr_A7]